MAYCNIEGKFLGKKLDDMFFDENRNVLANIIATDDFKTWFGEGRKDTDGNPVIDYSLSFTNEKGEKTTIFDFPGIAFSNMHEVRRFLTSLPGTYMYKGDVLVSNTSKMMNGSYSSQALATALNTVKFYYPDLIRVEKYTRSGTSPYSQGPSPLFVLKLNEGVSLQRPSLPLFSVHDDKKNETRDADRFNQMDSAEEILLLGEQIDQFRPWGLTQEDLTKIASPSKVNETVYESLKTFFHKMNPKANVEVIDDLPVAGVAYIKDFLIQLQSDAKYSAMPEEVAHFFIEMLPRDHPLFTDMMKNITSFAVYQTTLATYKSLPNYRLANGNVDYDKIKREAAGKLVAEYIYALSENDFERAEILSRTANNFLAKWWERFVNFFRTHLFLDRKERIASYMRAAKAILEQDGIDLDAENMIQDDENQVYFGTVQSDRTKVDIALITHILDHVKSANKLDQLNKVIEDFRKEMGRNVNSISKQPSFQKLNEELSNAPEGVAKDIKLNRLSELHKFLKDVKVDVQLDAENHITNLTKFISVVQSMENIAYIYNDVVDTYEDNGSEMNIHELMAFRNTYSNLQSLINDDLARVLANSEVGIQTATSLRKATAAFSSVENKILRKLRKSFEVIEKNTVGPQNAVIAETLSKELMIAFKTIEPKKVDAIKKLVDKFIENVKEKGSYTVALKEFYTDMALEGVKKDKYTKGIVRDLLNKMASLYVTDEKIADFLDGMGNDIDLVSQVSHWFTAATKNHDMIIANVAKYIVDRRSLASNKANKAIRDYVGKVDPIVKELMKMGLDEYQMGEAITFIDAVYDASVDSKGHLNHEDKVRNVISFLNPTINQANIDRQTLEIKRDEAKMAFEKADKNDVDKRRKLKTEWVTARNELRKFESQYFNSKYTKDYMDHMSKWYDNHDFEEIYQEWNNATQLVSDRQAYFDSDKRDATSYDLLMDAKKARQEIINKQNKTDEEIARIDLLQKFFEESNRFREVDILQTKRNYNLALNNYMNKIDHALSIFSDSGNDSIDNLEMILRRTVKDPSISIKAAYIAESGKSDINIDINRVRSQHEYDVVKKILDNRFQERNFIKVKTPRYYEVVKNIFEKINELKKLKAVSPIDAVVSAKFERMTEILRGKNDYYDQRNSETLSREELEELQELEDHIEAIKDMNIKTFVITDEMRAKPSNAKRLEDFDEYERVITFIGDALAKRIQATPQEVTDARKYVTAFNAYMEANQIVSKDQIKAAEEIKKMYEALRSLSEKVPTQAYWERMEIAVDIFEDMLRERLKKMDDPNLSAKGKVKLAESIRELTMLIHGRSPDTMYNPGYRGGLIGALADNNYQMLDEIINDEYLLPGERIPVQFTKYFDEMEGQTVFDAMGYTEWAQWFLDNHKQSTVFVKTYHDGIEVSSRPQDRTYVRRITAIYTEPMIEEDADGKPLYEWKFHKKYTTTRIKDEFVAKQVTWKDSDNMEDWTVSNKEMKATYLPKSRKQLQAEGSSATKYINKAYYDLHDKNDPKSKALQQYLNISMKTYLEEQDSKPDDIKAMFRLPVTSLDHYQSDIAYVNDLPDRMQRIGQNIKGYFSPTAETDAEDMLSGIDEIRDFDEYTQELLKRKIPKLGMNTKLPHQRVNRNVLAAMGHYMIRSKDFDARSDLNPVVKGLIDVMKATGNTGQKKRLGIIEDIYDQMILEELPDNITNKRFFRKAVSVLSTFSGLKLSADVIGGAINYIQANMNNLIESFAGKYITPSAYAVGYAKGLEMLKEMAIDFNKKSNLSYWTLLYQNFDFIRGEWQEDMLSRSSGKAKRFDWRKFLMYPRKNGELHAQSALAIGVLHDTKVDNMIDGKKYPMWDIYEKKGNDIVLKEGFWEWKKDVDGQEIIDPATGERIKIYPHNPIDGAKFLAIQKKIWSINLDLHGNYAALTQTEASRHSVGKMAELMKRWFVPGLQRRMGRESFDVDKENIDEGYYTTTAKALFNIVKEIGRGNLKAGGDYLTVMWTTPSKRENLKRTAADAGAAILMAFVISSGLFFGYDDDDPDRNKKLKTNSWLYNEALLVMLRSFAEQTSFIPVPPFGFTEMSRNLLDPWSVVKGSFGNAVGAASLLLFTAAYYLGVDQLENDVFITKESGAGQGETLPGFGWMIGRKGDWKLKSYIAKLFGYSGSQVDPAYYIRNFESLQNRLK